MTQPQPSRVLLLLAVVLLAIVIGVQVGHVTVPDETTEVRP